MHRARRHIEELNLAVAAFVASKPVRVETTETMQHGRPLFHFKMHFSAAPKRRTATAMPVGGF